MENTENSEHTPGYDINAEPKDQKSADNSSFYRKKQEADAATAGNRTEGSPKDINDPFFGTGSDSANTKPEDVVTEKELPGVEPKLYNTQTNSGGSHSATEKQEN